MELEQYPLFTVEAVKKVEKGWSAQGHLSEMGNIGEGHIAYLYYPPRTIVKGRIASLKRRRKKLVFVTEEQTADRLLQSGQTYHYLDGYWGERAVIVLDPSREWRRTRFVSQDAIEFRLTTGEHLRGRVEDHTSGMPDNLPFKIDPSVEAEVIPSGWDHEHCEICWETISDYAQPYGYKDENDHWVCEQCYNRYVEPGRIDFFSD